MKCLKLYVRLTVDVVFRVGIRLDLSIIWTDGKKNAENDNTGKDYQ